LAKLTTGRRKKTVLANVTKERPRIDWPRPRVKYWQEEFTAILKNMRKCTEIFKSNF